MQTKNSTLVWIAVVIIIILGAWYWWSMSSGSNTAVAPTTTSTTQTTPANSDVSVNGAPATAPSVQVLSSVTSAKLGGYLVAANGMTLYMSNNDGNGVSNCTGSCLNTWIPYTVDANNQLTGSKDVTKKIATLYSGDTTKAQLTYNNMPLYFYVKDTKVGDVNGNGVGGVWSVVAP